MGRTLLAAAGRACVRARVVLEATAGTSHHGRAPKERRLSPRQCPCIRHGRITNSATRRALAASLSTAPPPPETASSGAPAPRKKRGNGWRLRAQLARPTVGARRKERALSSVQCPLNTHRPVTTSAAGRARAASSSVSPTPERQRAPVRLSHARARDTRRWLGVGGGSCHVTPQARTKC